MSRQRMKLLWVALFICSTVIVSGCRNWAPHSLHMPRNSVHRKHPKPPSGSYYKDWDPYAATIELAPASGRNPVKTQHVLIATVKDKNGNPLPNRRVEWIIAEGSVGDMVEVDESGFWPTRGYKETNRYAISYTNNYSHVLTRGNQDPSDDIHLSRGQSWCVITSPIEGQTHVIAYAPSIYNWENHKAFAVKHWSDSKVHWPPAATNPVGTKHVLTTKVVRFSDGAPLSGYLVNYAIKSGPSAVFQPGGEQTASVKTDARGIAAVTLEQASPREGRNEIQIDVFKMAAGEQAMTLGSAVTTKTWVGARVNISKTGPATAVLGGAVKYGIEVSNPSKVDAQDVVVTDTLPEGISYVSSSPAAEVSGQTLSWSVGTLRAGSRRVMSVTAKAERGGSFVNPAVVTAAAGLSDRASVRTTVATPKLTLEKTGPAEAMLAELIEFTVIARNVGDVRITNVRVTDRLPDGLVNEQGGTSYSIPFGTLEPGQAKQAGLKARATRTGSYTNKAMATADGGLTAEASCQTVVRKASIDVTKTGPARRIIGRPATYTIVVTNTGDTSAKNAMLVDTLPAGTSFVSASDGGRYAGGKVSWNLGNLSAGGSRTVTLTLKPTQMGTIRNVTQATATGLEASDSATTVVEGLAAVLLEVVDTEDPIEVGANETYEIVVVNQGSADSTNIVISCTLPDEGEYVSATGPTSKRVEGSKVTFAPLAKLAPQMKATYRVTIKGIKAGDVRFRVSLTSDELTTPVDESESTHIYD